MVTLPLESAVDKVAPDTFAEGVPAVIVPVLPDDTADTLAARVLTQEHLIYPKVVAELLT